MLQLCVSQQHNDIPFLFRTTGIRVFSFEEALYHVFHYWRESMDDFLSESMITWVSELGLSFLASKIKEIADNGSFSRRVIGFLQLADYFADHEITSINEALISWEKRLEWEKLKERADYLIQRGEPGKALPLYKQALLLEENTALLNNISIAYMQLSAMQDALQYLTRAIELDSDNISLMLHYTEAAIMGHQFDAAESMLAKAAKTAAPQNADIPFLQGLMAFEQNNYNCALKFFDTAIELAPGEPYYAYKAADTHRTMHQYDKALAVLDGIKPKNAVTYVKEAEIHAAAGNITAALHCMRLATSGHGAQNADLWATLAKYYRKNNDWKHAESAINHALELAPDNDRVRLESARIKKGLGRTREYQTELGNVLRGFRERYRTES